MSQQQQGLGARASRRNTLHGKEDQKFVKQTFADFLELIIRTLQGNVISTVALVKKRDLIRRMNSQESTHSGYLNAEKCP